jgi:hypothetical protein
LRISIQDGTETMTLKLEGRVAGSLADELDKTWHALANRLRARKLHVDLCGVTDADAEGKQILADIHRETGADFLADTPLAKYLAQEARRWNHAKRKET